MRSTILIVSLFALTAFGASKTLDIYVIDVEGGNATLFVSPTGESMLIDTGNAVDETNEGNNSNRGNNCAYNQSTNTVGDIIFGRTNTNVNCDDVGNRVDGGWYQVGRGRDNNSIYERRVRDANGNLVIQRARRNSNGTFTILSSRGYNDNSDRQWRKAQRKQQKEQDKQYKKSRGDNGENDDNGDNRQGVVSGDDRSYVAGNAEAKGNGHGKGNGNGKGKHKGND